MLFNTPDTTAIAKKIEEQVRKELNLASPLEYSVETASGYKISTGLEVLKDAFRQGLKGQPDTVAVCHLNVRQPVAFDINVHVIKTRQSYILANQITYVAPFHFDLTDEILWDGQNFTGAQSAHLNANAALKKAVTESIRPQFKAGESVFTINSFATIHKTVEGASFILNTTPVLKFFGMKASLTVLEFTRLFEMIRKGLMG